MFSEANKNANGVAIAPTNIGPRKVLGTTPGNLL